MKKTTLIYLLFYAMVTIFLTNSCSDGTVEVSDKDKVYAKILTCTQPNNGLRNLTTDDYETLGIEGVTDENLNEINDLICDQNLNDVNSDEKIATLIENFLHADSPSSPPTAPTSPPNHMPESINQNISIDQDNEVTITLNAVDIDEEGIVSYTIDTPPEHGTLVSSSSILKAPNVPVSPLGLHQIQYLYTPNEGYFGSDLFTFHVNDAIEESNEATVNIEIIKTNIPPQAFAGQDRYVFKNTSIILKGLGSDEDGNIVKYIWENQDNVKISDEQNHTLLVEEVGTFNYKLTVTDNHDATDSDEVSIHVYERSISAPTPPPPAEPVNIITGTIHFKSIELK